MLKHLSLSLALTVLPVMAGPAVAAPWSHHIFDLNGSSAASLNPSLSVLPQDDAVLGAAGAAFADSFNGGTRDGPVPGDAGSVFAVPDASSGENSWIVDGEGSHGPKLSRPEVNHIYSGLPELETWTVLIVGLIGVGARSRHRSIPPGTSEY